ncbi:MAG: PQQ-dependent sugar dehydrogenase [Acidimicrobiales bacterium]
MSSLRPIAVCVALAVALTACGSDDPVAESSGTTVPVVTEAPSTTNADTTMPDSGVDPESPEETTTTTDAPAPGSVDGDLTQAVVGASPLGVYDEPVDTTVAANGELWLAQRSGIVAVLDPATGDLGDTVVDLSAETVAGGERGLLGMAADETHLYVNFTDLDGHTNIDAFVLDTDGRPGERHHLLTIEQPFGNHNGGGMAIGPDGHLYIGVGDGGSGGDPLGAGQDPTQILGSLLRIDPTPGAASPYEIPADNPYADGVDGRPEIFAIGLRNPWRFSFDPLTDDLWIADVGQNQWEEVDLLLGANGFGLGANLGWNLREGTNEFSGDRPSGNVDPVFEYPHAGSTPSGCSISGGEVYRGSAIPELVGSYVFGDYCQSSVWALSIVDDDVVFRDLGVPIQDLVGITADAEGELLTLSLGGGISRLVAG